MQHEWLRQNCWCPHFKLFYWIFLLESSLEFLFFCNSFLPRDSLSFRICFNTLSSAAPVHSAVVSHSSLHLIPSAVKEYLCGLQCHSSLSCVGVPLWPPVPQFTELCRSTSVASSAPVHSAVNETCQHHESEADVKKVSLSPSVKEQHGWGCCCDVGVPFAGKQEAQRVRLKQEGQWTRMRMAAMMGRSRTCGLPGRGRRSLAGKLNRRRL